MHLNVTTMGENQAPARHYFLGEGCAQKIIGWATNNNIMRYNNPCHLSRPTVAVSRDVGGCGMNWMNFDSGIRNPTSPRTSSASSGVPNQTKSGSCALDSKSEVSQKSTRFVRTAPPA